VSLLTTELAWKFDAVAVAGRGGVDGGDGVAEPVAAVAVVGVAAATDDLMVPVAARVAAGLGFALPVAPEATAGSTAWGGMFV